MNKIDVEKENNQKLEARIMKYMKPVYATKLLISLFL